MPEPLVPDTLWNKIAPLLPKPRRKNQYVLERIGKHPSNRIEELLPWNVTPHLQQPEAVTEALERAA